MAGAVVAAAGLLLGGKTYFMAWYAGGGLSTVDRVHFAVAGAALLVGVLLVAVARSEEDD
jgi:hypothetical protein